MLIVIFISLLLITGILFRMFAKKFKRTGYTLTIIGSIGLLIALISIPISHLIIGSEIEQFRIMKEMLTQQKIKIYANTQKEIIEKNQWLARVQFLNTTILDLWIPDRIESYKPLLLSKESSKKRFEKEKKRFEKEKEEIEKKKKEIEKEKKKIDPRDKYKPKERVSYVPPEKTKEKDKKQLSNGDSKYGLGIKIEGMSDKVRILNLTANRERLIETKIEKAKDYAFSLHRFWIYYHYQKKFLKK